MAKAKNEDLIERLYDSLLTIAGIAKLGTAAAAPAIETIAEKCCKDIENSKNT